MTKTKNQPPATPLPTNDAQAQIAETLANGWLAVHNQAMQARSAIERTMLATSDQAKAAFEAIAKSVAPFIEGSRRGQQRADEILAMLDNPDTDLPTFNQFIADNPLDGFAVAALMRQTTAKHQAKLALMASANAKLSKGVPKRDRVDYTKAKAWAAAIRQSHPKHSTTQIALIIIKPTHQQRQDYGIDDTYTSMSTDHLRKQIK